MVESGGTPTLSQRCNLCWQEANGSCFRTQCGHLFCESCAFQHFGQSQSCPACGVVLEEADISDLTLGLAPAHFRRMMFQEIYKDTDYRSVGQSVVRTIMSLTESVAFVLAQLTMEGQRAAESDVQLKDELAKQRHENGRLTMQLRNQSASVEQKLREADHKIRLREKELVDLQEAYKEKSRKCQAWEKAYGHLRSQTSDRSGRNAGGFTPPESPRAGVMRGGGGGVGSATQQRGGGGGGGGSSIQRPEERLRANSPRSSMRSGTFLGRTDHGGGVGGGGGGGTGGGSWSMPRPQTSRGTVVDHHHISPMLRPRQGEGGGGGGGGFSHSVTPSPTFPTQQEPTRFATKRPETPLAVRGYYRRNPSPSNRTNGGGTGDGGVGVSVGGGVRGGFFPPSKSSRTMF